jgi:hypothetical protein
MSARHPPEGLPGGIIRIALMATQCAQQAGGVYRYRDIILLRELTRIRDISQIGAPRWAATGGVSAPLFGNGSDREHGHGRQDDR